VSKLAQIRSILAELLPFNIFQNGGRHRFRSLKYVNFDGKSGCGTRFSASVLKSGKYNVVCILYSSTQCISRQHLW